MYKLAGRTDAIFFAFFRRTEVNARRAQRASHAAGEEHFALRARLVLASVRLKEVLKKVAFVL